ncbi:TPA: hypothetical protein ACH3X1_008375 [Trebouxia sp. C0004]
MESQSNLTAKSQGTHDGAYMEFQGIHDGARRELQGAHMKLEGMPSLAHKGENLAPLIIKEPVWNMNFGQNIYVSM